MAPKARRNWRKRAQWAARSALVVAALLWLWFDYSFVFLPDLSAVRHVKPGMTEHEVVEVFSAKPASRTPREFIGFSFSKVDPKSPLSQTRKYWNCDAGIVEVLFGPNGRVQGAHAIPYTTRPSDFRLKLSVFLAQIGLGWLGI
jgi:hypothetical protein